MCCSIVILMIACNQSLFDAKTETILAVITGNPFAQKQAIETSTRIVDELGITKNKNEFIRAIVQAQVVAEQAHLQYDLSDLYTFARSLPEDFRLSEDLDYALWMFRQSFPRQGHARVYERLYTKSAFLYADGQYVESVPGNYGWIKLTTGCKIATHLNLQWVTRTDSIEHYADESSLNSRAFQYVVDGYTTDLGSVPDNTDKAFVDIIISDEKSDIYIHENSFAEGNVLEILYRCDYPLGDA